MHFLFNIFEFIKVKTKGKHVTSESFEHLAPPVDQALPDEPHPELHTPLVHEHCFVHFHLSFNIQ